MILLADADILVYQAASKNQESYKWDQETGSTFLYPLEDAIQTLDKDIASLMKATKCTEALFALSSSPNFRYDVLPTYKHNRKDVAKPLHLQDLREYLLQNYKCKLKPTLEGDDVMGILMTKYPNKYLCASIDKDMKQIPGKHYNWKNEEFFTITETLGDYWFYRQTLTGDPGDGYCGCPKIGSVKAERILQEVLEAGTPWANPKQLRDMYWKAIVDTYEAKGLTEEDALQQARVARILRVSDWNFKKHEVILWKP